jgi:formylglycine-generating enzyme required for sulfatase activity
VLLLLGSVAPASAVSIDWVSIGDPGNAADTTGYGSVAYTYQISNYEVTNAQYAEFLNAKAVADPLELYNTEMGSGYGGIARSESPGSYRYSAIPGRENLPVNFVSFYDSLRFINWLNNGQGSGDTETGAYMLVGGTPTPSNGWTLTRSAGATIFLTSEDEWYKAAYYDIVSRSYFDFPAGSDAPMACAKPGATPNTGNCARSVGDLTAVGSYTGSASPNGTFDQGGNDWEWTEAILGGTRRGLRGGSFLGNGGLPAASVRSRSYPEGWGSGIGLRVVNVPEPSTGLLVTTGMLGLARLRRRRGQLQFSRRRDGLGSGGPRGSRARAGRSPPPRGSSSDGIRRRRGSSRGRPARRGARRSRAGSPPALR